MLVFSLVIEDPSFRLFITPRGQTEKNAEKERGAMIVMTYFHPFTLLQRENVDVPHVSDLRRGNDKWESLLVK